MGKECRERGEEWEGVESQIIERIISQITFKSARTEPLMGGDESKARPPHLTFPPKGRAIRLRAGGRGSGPLAREEAAGGETELQKARRFQEAT